MLREHLGRSGDIAARPHSPRPAVNHEHARERPLALGNVDVSLEGPGVALRVDFAILRPIFPSARVECTQQRGRGGQQELQISSSLHRCYSWSNGGCVL
jgi:hypothetical protein